MFNEIHKQPFESDIIIVLIFKKTEIQTKKNCGQFLVNRC